MGLSRTISKIKGDSCKIISPVVFNVPAEGYHWNFVRLMGFKNKNDVPTIL